MSPTVTPPPPAGDVVKMEYGAFYVICTRASSQSVTPSPVDTAADFELDEHHVIKNEKVALDRLRVRQSVFLV